MKTRILGTSLGLIMLAGTVIEVLGQDQPSAQANHSKLQSRKATGTKVRRRGSNVPTRAGSSITANGSQEAISGGSDGLIASTSAAKSSTDGETTQSPADQTSDPVQSPSDPEKPKTEVATFGAGCFWHVEAEFEWLPGVKSAVSGYSGGNLPNPTYQDVHEGWTGHAEVVRVEYDPSVISYEKLLHTFWSGHDPTQLNHQGPDYGTQYRSVIFYHSPQQKQAALQSYQELTKARVYRAPIVTQLLPMQAFYPAEDYHQNYYGGKDTQMTGRKRKQPRKPSSTSARAAAKPLAVGSRNLQKTAAGSTSAKSAKMADASMSPGTPTSRPQ